MTKIVIQGIFKFTINVIVIYFRVKVCVSVNSINRLT